MIVLVDDGHGHSGDLAMAAETVNPEAVNFMAMHGRGLICLSLTPERIAQLDLPLMVRNEPDYTGAAFTVSIEAATGVTTGISAADRARTILTAIEKVYEGQLWLDRIATGRIFFEFSRENAAQAADPERAKIASLTEREREIVAVAATHAGANARSIADLLSISEHTLRNHLTSIYDKLDVANRLELFAYAHKHGLTKRPS